MNVSAVSSALVFIANQKGFFKNEGLDAKLDSIPTTEGQIAALNGGNDDVAWLGPDAVNLAIQAGANIKLFASLGNANKYELAIAGDWAKKNGITAQTSPVEAVKKLRGARIATTGTGGTLYSQLQDALKLGGLSNSDVNLVQLGSGTAQVAAIEHNAIDALVYAPPITTMAQQRASAVVIPMTAFASVEPAFNVAYTLCNLAAGTAITKLPNVLTAYTVALMKARQWALANPAEAYQLVSKAIPGTDQAVYDTVVPSFSAEMMPTEEAHNAIVHLYNLGRAPSTPEVTVTHAQADDTTIVTRAKEIVASGK